MASLDDSVIDVDATLNPDKKEEEEEVFGPFSFKNINPRKGKPIIPRPKKDVFRFWPTNADYSFKDDSTLISCYANADDPAFSAVKLNIKNFSPNFYLKLPRGWGAHMCNELLQFLNKKLTYVLKRDLVFQEQKYDRLCDLVKGGKKLIKEEVEKKKKKIEVLTERLNAINDVVNADIKQVGIIVKNRIKSLCTVDKKKDVKRSKTDKANPLGKDKGKEKKAKIEETEEVKKLREFEERAIFLIRKKSEIDITQLKTKISKLENEVTDPGGIVQNKAWIKSQSLRAMIDELKAVTESETPYVTSYEFTEANEFVYWSPEGTKFEFVKFYVSYPKLVKKCRTILENPKHYFKFHEELIPDIEPDDAYKQHFQIFEADVDFILRWLVDTHSTPCTWFKIDPGKYNLTEAKDRSSRCPIEIDVNYEDILKEEAPEYANKTPDLVEFVTDIEVKTNGKRFCRSDTDEICDIVVAVSRMSEQKPVYYSFTLGSTDHDDPDNNVFNYNDEKVMLRDFIKFLRAVDPDVIGHHNGNAFDIPYIVRRCVNLGIKEAIYIGRATRKPIYKHSNTNRGKKKTYVNIPGVTNVDLLRYAEDNYTWDGNTLSEIAYRILDKQTKLEMAYEQIEEHTKTKKGRTRLLKYCKVDVYLTWAILRKLKYYLCIETARLAKIPLDYALNKALGMKVKGRLLQECVQNKPGFICKLKRTTPKITIPGYAGAKVLPPRPGYYLGEIVITLDFASMYPSIIQWRNICYTTLLKESDIIKYGFKEGVDYWRLPDNVDTGKGVETRHNPKNPAFKITKTVVEIDPKTGEKKERIVDQGMLPRMEAELAAERKRVRGKAEALELELEKMKKEGKGDTPIFGTLKVEFEMLNGRQLAIKMWMNAIYGLAGDKTSSYYKVELALTVTQTGQFMILTVKYTVEDNFNHKYGWTFDATIIYGDTDSVFVWLKGFTGTWAEACSIGLFMAKTVTKMNFSGPVKLEFEKLFINLVMPDDGKKMYYGTKVEATYCSGEKQPYIDKKGLAMKKRGPSLYFKETCKIAIEYICEHGDVNTAFEKVQERLMNLAKGNYQIHELIEKRGLSKDPKEYENVKEIPIVKGDETLTDIAKKMVRDEDEKKMRKRKANVMEDYFDDNGTSKGEEDEYDPEFEERVKKITKRIERTLSGKGKGVTDNADDSEDEGNIDEEKDDNVFPGSLNLIEFASKQFPKGSDIFTILEKLGENAYNAERPKSKYQRRGIHPAGNYFLFFDFFFFFMHYSCFFDIVEIDHMVYEGLSFSLRYCYKFVLIHFDFFFCVLNFSLYD